MDRTYRTQSVSIEGRLVRWFLDDDGPFGHEKTFFVIFGLADLRICLSGAKFHEEPDFACGRRTSWRARGGVGAHADRRGGLRRGPSGSASSVGCFVADRRHVVHRKSPRRAYGLPRRPPPLLPLAAGCCWSSHYVDPKGERVRA